jgi:hypothetical protein
MALDMNFGNGTCVTDDGRPDIDDAWS